LIALAVEQMPAEFGLELLDGAGEGRLRQVNELCSAVEIQGSAHREKILDLVHLHVRLQPDKRRASSDEFLVFCFLAGSLQIRLTSRPNGR
jgi:hypothetical protein